MRVFVAGATGVIGRRLVPRLIDRGHEVVGTYTSSTEKAEHLRGLGAKMVRLDVLDAAAVRTAVLEAEPHAIVHEATALANGGISRKLDKTFATTNRLRTAGTDALLAAASDGGVRRVVAQSFAPYRYARQGGMVKAEDDPLDPDPPAGARETNAAMAHLEKIVTDFGGIALRYGGFYGDDHDQLVRLVRKRWLPLIGDGGGFMSWIHLDDAAARQTPRRSGRSGGRRAIRAGGRGSPPPTARRAISGYEHDLDLPGGLYGYAGRNGTRSEYRLIDSAPRGGNPWMSMI